MRSDRFAEAHAPLFRAPASKDAATLTEWVASSLPRRNFIDEHIFAKMARWAFQVSRWRGGRYALPCSAAVI